MDNIQVQKKKTKQKINTHTHTLHTFFHTQNKNAEEKHEE